MAPVTPDFSQLNYLAKGSATQKAAYLAIIASNVFGLLEQYTPLLVGTLPLDLFTPYSDLDVLCYAPVPDTFATFVQQHFNGQQDFSLSRKKVNGIDTVIARFSSHGYLFEIFAQPIPPHRQVAYRHLLAEYTLLHQHGEKLKLAVMGLKLKGVKTEPAFAQALDLPGDPFETLLLMGDQQISNSSR